jgi:FKBP-type peptidyl-prolyl cis-trans isomerase
LRAVRELGRDPELALTADLDTSDTEVPPNSTLIFDIKCVKIA